MSVGFRTIVAILLITVGSIWAGMATRPDVERVRMALALEKTRAAGRAHGEACVTRGELYLRFLGQPSRPGPQVHGPTGLPMVTWCGDHEYWDAHNEVILEAWAAERRR